MVAFNLWAFLEDSQNLSRTVPPSKDICREPPLPLEITVLPEAVADVSPNFSTLLSLLKRLAVDTDSSPIYLANWMEVEGKAKCSCDRFRAPSDLCVRGLLLSALIPVC